MSIYITKHIASKQELDELVAKLNKKLGYYIFKHGHLQASHFTAGDKRVHIIFEPVHDGYQVRIHIDRIVAGFHKVINDAELLDRVAKQIFE